MKGLGNKGNCQRENHKMPPGAQASARLLQDFLRLLLFPKCPLPSSGPGTLRLSLYNPSQKSPLPGSPPCPLRQGGTLQMPVLFYSAPNRHTAKPTRSYLRRLWSPAGTVSWHRVGVPETCNECKLNALAVSLEIQLCMEEKEPKVKANHHPFRNQLGELRREFSHWIMEGICLYF